MEDTVADICVDEPIDNEDERIEDFWQDLILNDAYSTIDEESSDDEADENDADACKYCIPGFLD